MKMTKTGNAMAHQEDKAGPVVVTHIGKAKMTLAEVQAKLDGKTGRRFWKNLEELSDDHEFQELMAEEFPRQAGAGEWVDPISRRGFMKVMGASFALAGLAGCTKQPDETIYPYIKQPEDLVLGKAMYFATAYPFPTGAIPVLVKSDAFRPIKIEGNPDHPSPRVSPMRIHRQRCSNCTIQTVRSTCSIADRTMIGGTFSKSLRREPKRRRVDRASTFCPKQSSLPRLQANGSRYKPSTRRQS